MYTDSKTRDQSSQPNLTDLVVMQNPGCPGVLGTLVTSWWLRSYTVLKKLSHWGHGWGCSVRWHRMCAFIIPAVVNVFSQYGHGNGFSLVGGDRRGVGEEFAAVWAHVRLGPVQRAYHSYHKLKSCFATSTQFLPVCRRFCCSRSRSKASLPCGHVGASSCPEHMATDCMCGGGLIHWHSMVDLSLLWYHWSTCDLLLLGK